MSKKIDYVRQLLIEKEENIKDEVDKKKIDNLKCILKEDDIFFKLDISTAIGILSFLGVPESDIKNLYLSLISPQQFKENDNNYYSVSNLL